MDRKTFLLTREQIQNRMEGTRAAPSSFLSLSSPNGTVGLIPLSFSVFSTVFFRKKRTLLRAILITAGVRVLAPFVARRVWALFSKTKPATS